MKIKTGKKYFKRIFSILMSLMLFSAPVFAAPEMNFVIENDKRIKTPLCYKAVQVISDLGESGSTFREATDIFIGSDDSIYIADGQKNRIIKLNPDGSYNRDFTNSGGLSGPKSVFVTENGDLFVSDTGNQQIVHLNKTDELIESFVKPETDLLSDMADFSVNRLAVSKQGLIYLIYSQQFMMIDAKNDFKGFVGANKVSFNLKEFFIRTFGSEIQKKKMKTEQAAAYNAFAIGENDLVYAVANDTKNQIRILNVDGKNIFPEGVYGQATEEDKSTNSFGPDFIDIGVDKNGIIYALEKYSCQVYSFTSKGEMIAVFGGIGNIRGKFATPVAVDVNSKGEVFVLDSSNGTLHRFSPTDYIESIHSAYMLFENGKYEASMEKWNRVLDVNVNCSLANSAMGNISMKQENYKAAMSYFKNSDDKAGYSKAFSEYRHEIFRQYFGWIVLAAAVLGVLIYFLIRLLFFKGRKAIDTYYYGGGGK